MSYHHIRITSKSKPNQTEVALDLSLQMLMDRYVSPYRKGQPILIRGRTIASNDLERLQISVTEEDSSVLREIVRQERSRRAAGGFIDIGGPSNNERIARKGKDVTDEFITGPPGSDARATHAFQEEVRPSVGTREVFVVHGRNFTARDALFQFLRAIDLHPLEWSQAVAATGRASPYIGEILGAAFSRAHAVLVLLTPDDEARLREPFRSKSDPPHETQLTGQARANVLFEAGMAMGRNADRTVLVELGSLRPFSDVAGLHVIRLDDTTQRRQELAQRLSTAGCPVNLEGTDWHTAGDFGSALELLDEETEGELSGETREAPVDEESHLTEDAKELLLEVKVDRRNTIMMVRTMGGTIIQTNGKDFAETGNRRSEAKWEQAVGDLLEEGYIQDPGGHGEVFELTQRGFEMADKLDSQST